MIFFGSIGKLNYRLGLIGRFSIIVVTPSLYLMCVVEDSLLNVSREMRLYIFRNSYSLRHELSLILLTSTQERHKICFYRRCIVYSLLLEKYEVLYIGCSYIEHNHCKDRTPRAYLQEITSVG